MSLCAQIEKYALVIGINTYPKYDQGQQLHYANKDAKDVSEFLQSREGGGFLKANVKCLQDAQATREQIETQFKWLREHVKPGDLVWIFFSGHGVIDDKRDRAYLMPADADPRLPSDRGLRADDFLNDLKLDFNLQHLVVFIDACHAGSARGTQGTKGTTEQNAGSVMASKWAQAFNDQDLVPFAIFSAASNEQSAETTDLEHGLFAYFLLKGLGGAADKPPYGNNDGTVTAGELWRYVSEKVPEYAAQHNLPPQHPIPSPTIPSDLPLAILDNQIPCPVGACVRGPVDSLTYVPLPGGEFDMGCVPMPSKRTGENCTDFEKPRHKVKITNGFSIGATEVTVAAYQRYLREKQQGPPASPFFNTDWQNVNQPMVNVRWGDAQAYCAWAGGRLPTEAEWEYAARYGGATAVYTWGDSTTADYAKYAPSKLKNRGVIVERGPAVVGSFHASAAGLYDMAGNVGEWVSDWYDEHYYRFSPAEDPSGPPNGHYRVVRGGPFYDDENFVRTSFRFYQKPDEATPYTGFRCLVPSQNAVK